ncbi:MAG: cysteine sulfinate desulfinase [candidate division NC10 bacterium RIFCSPLOWO2_12_FULL_66_18]|nr:MAG: cysteine sulfinate desulfinase [candidate division NC10 bacterium RIFCSPLOWO2_02_FULL_66_22]OGB95890.1 MAG: cysteine sulfinate desulfinase [candidate division NC10 bacterium RIFCSPLOWO2_12_FULL_66_18]
MNPAGRQVAGEVCNDCLVGFGVERIRQDFPALQVRVHGKPLVYLDNAATSQKPQVVIDRITRYYLSENSNIHRGVHFLSDLATQAYESTRDRVRQFLNAAHDREIIFTRGTTEGINLVAHSFGRSRVRAGDEIVISAMEHHSNIVPWQILCEEKGATLRVIPVNDAGELLLEEYERLLCDRTRLVAVTYVSNALGTVNPIKPMIATAHRRGIPVLVDGAQAAPHLAVDVQELDCDFYAFSGHKLCGPTGIGILYGKADLLESMPPYQGGGDMISAVTFEKTIYNSLPYKFEAGTPHIAGVIGLGAALEYVQRIGLPRIAAYEADLLAYGTELLSAIPGLRIIGTAREKASVLSFVLDGIHAHDVGTILDHEGIAIRAGHHCAMPVMKRFGVSATARASLAFYNTREELEALAKGLHKVIEVFA